ncbi:MAG: 6-phosphofructokinase [Bacteroidota bacterium]
MKRIAFLTSGGDSPGMNACIRAIVKACLFHEITPYAISNGYKGMIENQIEEFNYSHVNNIIQLGGTIIGTSRSEKFKEKKYRDVAISNLRDLNIDGLIVIGGDGTFTGATVLSSEMNIPIIGIPGTIDNDIYGTDHTIGFDTALNTIISAVDKIRDTATSHHRIFFIEVMGRHSGYLALNAAIASGAESVLIPEHITNIEELARQIKIQNKGERSSIVIVAEGDDSGGSLEIMKKVKPFLPDYDFKSTVLGHIQRGGSPSAFDRILATKMGVYAVDLLKNNKTKLMIGVKGDILHTILIEKGIKFKNDPLNSDKFDLLKKMLTTN